MGFLNSKCLKINSQRKKTSYFRPLMGFLNSKLAKAVTAIAKCKFPSPHGVSQFQMFHFLELSKMRSNFRPLMGFLNSKSLKPNTATKYRITISVPSWGFSIPNEVFDGYVFKDLIFPSPHGVSQFQIYRNFYGICME